MTDLLTTQEAADAMRIHEKTVRRMILRGELPAARVGRSYRIRATDLPLEPVRLEAPMQAPRSRPVREGKPGRFSQIAREMDAA